MGIEPIEYRPWKGERSAQGARLYVIARSIIRHKLKSAGVLVLLILGFLMLHVLQMILMILIPHETLEAQTMYDYMGSGGAFVIFGVLLAAVVTSDLIADDLAHSSFVLYFSRAIRVRDYLAGKSAAALFVMALLCFFPPIGVALAAIATQSGDAYSGSAEVLGRTVAAAAVATVLFVPYGLLMSSLTKRRSYAAVGTFMSFFALTIVSQIFSEFDRAWEAISPMDSLGYAYAWIFGVELPGDMSGWVVLTFLAGLVAVPSAVVYLKLKNHVVGA